MRQGIFLHQARSPATIFFTHECASKAEPAGFANGGECGIVMVLCKITTKVEEKVDIFWAVCYNVYVINLTIM